MSLRDPVCFARRMGAWRGFFFPSALYALSFVVVCLILPSVPPVSAMEPDSGTRHSQPRFSFTDVKAEAQRLAGVPYAEPEGSVPEFLCSLSLEQWRGIAYTDAVEMRWAAEKLPVHPRLLVPGYMYTRPVAVNVVDEKGVRRLSFLPELARTGDKELAERLLRTDTGFAGFEMVAPVADGSGAPLGMMTASHFIFSGRNARPGVFSRPLALDTATPPGECFPIFREYWLRKPNGDEPVTVYALMDSPAVAGAFEFVLSPGTSLIVDVRAVFFPRRGATEPKKVGLAPLTGMFLFSETGKGDFVHDYRPETHNCDGLLVASGENDWTWTPLKNPVRLGVGEMPVAGLRGFGLLQRDTSFDHYQDLQARFERSSSVWVEPKGDWGDGRIELVEIPGTREYHSNILAYWVPAPRPSGTTQDAGEEGIPAFSVEYRLYWMPPDVKMHELGVVRDTRMEQPAGKGVVTFYIDFEGEALNGLSADTGLTSVVGHPKEVVLLEKSLLKNDVTGGWRLVLKMELPQSGVLDGLLAARKGPPQLPLTAYLKKGENLSEVLTETWRYTVTP